MTVQRAAHKVTRLLIRRLKDPLKCITVAALTMTELGVMMGLKKDQMLALLNRAWTEGE